MYIGGNPGDVGSSGYEHDLLGIARYRHGRAIFRTDLEQPIINIIHLQTRAQPPAARLLRERVRSSREVAAVVCGNFGSGVRDGVRECYRTRNTTQQHGVTITRIPLLRFSLFSPDDPLSDHRFAFDCRCSLTILLFAKTRESSPCEFHFERTVRII